MATSAEYVATVWHRLTKGKPQPEAGLWRSSIQSTLDAALQRLGGRVAASKGMHASLMHEWAITLGAGGTAGQDPIIGLTPTLILDTSARKWWRVTMTGVRHSLKYKEHLSQLENPPPIPDLGYMYYTIFDQAIVVRDFQGQIPAETALQLFANKIPLITDPAISDEIFDDLVDTGAAIIMESGELREVIRQAEHPTPSILLPPQSQQ